MNPLADATSILISPPRAAPAEAAPEPESEFAALVTLEEESEDTAGLLSMPIPLPLSGATGVEETAAATGLAASEPAGRGSDRATGPGVAEMPSGAVDGPIGAAIPGQPEEPALAVLPGAATAVGPANPAKVQPDLAPDPAPVLPAGPEALRPMVVSRPLRPGSSDARAAGGDSSADPDMPARNVPPISGAQVAFALRVQEAAGAAAPPGGDTVSAPEPAGTEAAEVAQPAGAAGEAPGGGGAAFDLAAGVLSAPLPPLSPRPVLGQVQAAISALVRDREAPPQAGAVVSRDDTGPERGLELRLDPEELGKVSILMRTEGESLVVRVVAERPETLDLLRRHADQLLQDLRGSGFRDAQMAFGAAGQGPQGERRLTAGGQAPFPAEDAAILPATIPPAAFGPVPGGGLNLRF